MALIPKEVKFDTDLIPNPVFVPDSEEKREFYFKLADLAGEKVVWSCKVLLFLTVVSFVSVLWTSGSTIRLCFDENFNEIDICICIKANNGKVDVTRTISLSLLDDRYFSLTVICLLLTMFYAIMLRRFVRISIRLLAYGVKLTYYGVYGAFYTCLGLITGFLFLGISVQNPNPLFDPNEQNLYFWGYPNYPLNPWQQTTRLATDLGVLAGIIKIILTSIKDPLALFCSLSDMIQVSSNLQVHVPVIKYTTQFSLFVKVKPDTNNTHSNDYQMQQILTTLEKQGLLLPYEPHTKELGVVDVLKEWIGLRSYGNENEIKALISKGQLSSEERGQLQVLLKKLILNVHTKRWPLILLISMGFSCPIVTFVINVGEKWDLKYSILLPILDFLSTTGMYWYVEYSLALHLCFFSFLGACVQMYVATKLTINLIKYTADLYYYPTIYLIIPMSFIYLIAKWKFWRIISVIKAGKKELSKEESEKSGLPAPLVSEIEM